MGKKKDLSTFDRQRNENSRKIVLKILEWLFYVNS